MRNSWGFRGVQRSSFSHCAHRPPVAVALRVPFQPRNIPEKGRHPPPSHIQREQGARLARLARWIMYMRCRITTCHPGLTAEMRGCAKLHLPLTSWGFGTLMKVQDTAGETPNKSPYSSMFLNARWVPGSRRPGPTHRWSGNKTVPKDRFYLCTARCRRETRLWKLTFDCVCE